MILKAIFWSIVLFYNMMDEHNNILHPCLFFYVSLMERM